MRQTVLWGGLAALLVGACVKADFTHCPTVDCPTGEVCDGFGGCATPDQLSQCSGQTDGATCSYATLSNVHIDGACDQGVCRSLQIPACLTDQFLNQRVDTAMWDLYLPENQPVVVTEDSGKLAIELAPNVGRVYNGIQSRGRYDMIAGDLTVDVQPASQDVGVETSVGVDLDATLGFEMTAYANRLHLVVHTSGGVTNSIAVDFDPVAQRFWRIRHDGANSTMELETSPDRQTWTSQRSAAVSRVPTGVSVTLLAGTYTDQGVETPGTAYFHDLKLTSAACP